MVIRLSENFVIDVLAHFFVIDVLALNTYESRGLNHRFKVLGLKRARSIVSLQTQYLFLTEAGSPDFKQRLAALGSPFVQKVLRCL